MITSRIIAFAVIAAMSLGITADSQDTKPAPSEQKKKDADREKPAEIQWRADYKEARKVSEDNKLPMLIFFNRPTSFYCDKQLRDLANHAGLVQFVNSRIISLKLNAHEEATQKLAAKLEISIFPTLIVADWQGKYEMMIGYQEPGELLKKLQAAAKRSEAPK